MSNTSGFNSTISLHTPAAYSYTYFTTINEITAIADEWRQLYSLTGCANPFLLPVWYLSWFKHAPERSNSCISVIRQGTDIVAIIPYRKQIRRFPGISITIIVPILQELADYNDILIKSEHADALVGWLADSMKSQKWDVAYFKDVSGDAALFQGLRRLPRKEIPQVIVRPGTICPFIPIAGDWETYWKSLFSNSKERNTSERKLRKIQKGENARFYNENDFANGTWTFDDFQKVENHSWKARKGSGLFSNDWKRSFFSDLFAELQKDGILFMEAVSFDDHPTAYQLGFKLKGKYSFYSSSFDAAFSSTNAGYYTIVASIRRCFAERGLEFDFLRGADRYKKELTQWARRNLNVYVFKNATVATTYSAFLNGKQLIKGVFKKRSVAWEGTIVSPVDEVWLH
jgi:CelD/BcsL family acetyltransferase involved in cellulose biosynthesis